MKITDGPGAQCDPRILHMHHNLLNKARFTIWSRMQMHCDIDGNLTPDHRSSSRVPTVSELLDCPLNAEKLTTYPIVSIASSHHFSEAQLG
jgi:hypothetical protein